MFLIKHLIPLPYGDCSHPLVNQVELWIHDLNRILSKILNSRSPSTILFKYTHNSYYQDLIL